VRTRDYLTVADVVAMFESLAVNHPFIDGNKRIAFAAVDVFLRINGHRIQRLPGDIHADMMRMFETGTLDIAHLEPWLRALVVKAD
jgi:death-on-curing protein